jgi:hypothetical protein
LVRSPRSLFTLLPWACIALFVAWSGRGRGADDGLAAYAALPLPLLSFAAVGAVLGAKSLGDAVDGLHALGATRRAATLVHLLAALALSAFLTAAVGAGVAALGHGPHDPPVLRDVLSSAGISGLGGFAYGSLFLLGATFGKGAGRSVLLFVDFAFGGSNVAALLFPRGHVRSLFGGAEVADLSARQSSLVLPALGLFFLVLAFFRARRRR